MDLYDGGADAGEYTRVVEGDTSMITAEHAARESGSAASRLTLDIFIVDSDAKVRERLAAIIRAAGWQPRAFESAEELLADPDSVVPGCIVLDIDLPGLSGLELQQGACRATGDIGDLRLGMSRRALDGPCDEGRSG
jgi:PleD family two-component response regulator